MILDVEVLDVGEDETRALLLSIDPLASLAGVQEQLRDRLEAVAPLMPEELRLAWQAAAGALVEEEPERPGPIEAELAEQFYLLIRCRDEKQQVELLGRLSREGLDCKAVLA